jgi:DNA-directed RNA polymerase subunit RPC12/RpoP
MSIEKCTNKDCGKEFSVTLIGAGVPGGKETEPVICPYCGTVVRTERTSGTFLTGPIEKKLAL